MAWDHRLSNAGSSALSWGSSGAGIGSFFGPKGAAIGAGVGGVLGLLKGLFSDTELQELADRYAAGEIDPDTEQKIKRLVADRFKTMRTQQGGRIARAGIKDSTFAERMRMDMDASERDATSEALLNQIESNRRLGLNMLNQQGQQNAQVVGGSIDNIMNILSGFKADERFETMRADANRHQDRWLALAEGGGTKLNPMQAKAYAAVGTMPAGDNPGLGTYRGASKSGNLATKWQDLSGGKSVTRRRTGGGSYGARNSNAWTSGSRNRSHWNTGR